MPDEVTLKLIKAYELVIAHVDTVCDEAYRQEVRAKDLLLSLHASLDRVRELPMTLDWIQPNDR